MRLRLFDRPEPERSTTLLVGAAVAWSLLLLVLAVALPVVTPQSPPAFASSAPSSAAAASAPAATTVLAAVPRVTLLADDGSGVLLLVALPSLLSLLVGLLLWLRVSRGSRAASGAAWGLAGVVTAAAVVGFVTFLIGIFVLPVGVLLLVACEQSRSRLQLPGRGAAVGGPSGGSPA